MEPGHSKRDKCRSCGVARLISAKNALKNPQKRRIKNFKNPRFYLEYEIEDCSLDWWETI